MIRKTVATLSTLGLIGGAGAVHYNSNGDATVKITDTNGRVQSVVIRASSGKSFSCPAGTHDHLEPMDIEIGRIKLTLQQVRRSEQRLERLYPSHRAPHAVVVQYNALVTRDRRLVSAFNAEVDAHNAYLDSRCTPGN